MEIRRDVDVATGILWDIAKAGILYAEHALIALG
jgi:hypothetical protein